MAHDASAPAIGLSEAWEEVAGGEDGKALTRRFPCGSLWVRGDGRGAIAERWRGNTMSTDQKTIASCIALLATIGSGLWLTASGKPYNAAIFTVHKLIALAAAVSTGLFMFNLLKTIGFGVVAILVVTSVVSVLALFISGALLSIGNTPYHLAKTVHVVASIVAVVSAALSVYLMLTRK